MTTSLDNFETVCERLAERAYGILLESPRCHDWDHTLRVLANARALAAQEGADEQVVRCAALLHDIGRADEITSKGHMCHAETGAAQAKDILKEAGFTEPLFVSHVTACIRTHRYRTRNGEQPATLEAEIIYDADKLDALGAIGIGRAFHFAGRIGARVHNSRTEALDSEAYGLQDSAYREYLVKLSALPENMLTRTGKALAEDRAAFMKDFFDRLEKETET